MKIGNLFSSVALIGLSVVGLAPQLSAQTVSASPTSLSLNAIASSNTPVTQTLTLSVSGGSGQTLSVSTAGAWLKIVLSPNCTTPTFGCALSNPGNTVNVTVYADPTGLAQNTYSGQISLTLTGSANPSVQIPVTFTVGTGNGGGGGGTGVLVATPSTLTFSGIPNGNGQSQNVAISNAGASINYNVTSSATWLSTNLGSFSGISPGNLSVIVSPNGLTANTYNGTLTLQPVGGGQTTSIQVTFVVSSTQQFQITPSALTFSSIAGSGQAISPQNLTVGVTTGNPVTYALTAIYGAGATNWLTFPASGTTGNNAVSITANAGSLAVGTYTATLRFTANSLTTHDVPVTLTVSSPPSFTVSPTSISINVQPNGTATRTLTIGTSNSASVNYTVTPQYQSPANPSVPWLTLQNASGNTPGGVTVGVSPGNLGVGTYTALLTITSTTPGVASTTVSVTMVVTTSQIVTFTPTSLSFSFVGGSATPASQFVQLALSPSTPIQTATVGAVPDILGQTWLSATLSSPSGSQITGNSAAIVTVNPSGLANGTYTGKVQVNISTANGPVANTLVEIPVSFTVTGVTGGGGGTGNTTVLLSQGQFIFNTLPGGTADQTISLTSSTTTQVPFTLSTSTPWLTILNGSGTTPGSSTVRVFTSGLAAGTYSGSITLTASGASNNGVQIPVTLTVSSQNQLQINPSGLSYTYTASSGLFPNSQTLTVSSTAGSLPVTATASTTSGGAWLSVTPTSLNTQGNFVVSVNSAVLQSLGVSTYSGNILLTTSGALNNSINIPVSLTITGTSTGGGGGGGVTPQLVFGPNPMTIYVTSGLATQQTLEIGTSTGTSVSYSLTAATSNGSWLSVNPTSGSAPGQVTVTANSSGLSAGTYSGSITVTSSGASNPTTVIPVNLVVTAQGTTNLVASPAGAVFTVAPGTTSLLQRLITISTTNNVQVPITVTTDSSTNALTVTTNSNTTPASITVSLNPSNFTAGIYQGTVFVNSSTATNSPLALPITLIVTASSSGGGTAQLTASPNSLTFVGQPNGAPPPQQTVQMTSSGSAISYSVTSNQSWLLAGPSSGTTPGTITVGVNPAGLAAGTYSGNVTVVGGGSTVSLPVTFNVTNSPVLQLSQQSVTFNYQTGQTLPAPRPILVTTSNGASVSSSVTVNTSNGGNWLTASPTSLQTPGAFALSLVNNIVSTLAAGTYTGTVTVNATGTANASTTINVTLNVSSTALLTMSTTPMTFNAQFNGSQPPSQVRQITATSGSLNVSVSTSTTTGSGWLSANVNSNVTPATLTISASPFNLGTGVYTGTVTVSSGSSSSALVIPVTLNVSSLPLISIDKSELIFGSGGTSGTQPQTIQVSSSSANFNYTVNATVTNSPTNWLSVNNVSGITPSALTVTVNPALLGDGTYFGTIVLTAPGAGNTPLVIPVTLTVNQSTALAVNPTSLSFTQLQGGALPVQQSVQVTSQLPTPFSVTSAVQSPVGGNWLVVNQSGGLTNGFLQVSLNNTASALPPGVYNATITVFGANSPNSVPIAVTLTVVPSATTVVSPATLTFNGRVGQPNPPAQTVQISSSNAATPVPYVINSDATWLSASPTVGTTPGTISVTANVAGLTAGTYTGRLSVTPSGVIAGQATVITVSFVVEQVTLPVISGFANAATFQAGSLSPGMIFTLVGTNMGPATAVTGQVVGGRFTTTLAGVRVLFDGVAAPILYASATQINAVVPYSMAGRASSRMSVEYNGVSSVTIEPRLNDTAPGIFTTDGRQAAMFNENGTFNSGSNPAPAGTIVVIYVTGEGATNPAGVDGEVIGSNLKRPIGAVRVRVGGVEVPAADIFYAGSAPTLVSGLMQINFRLPLNTPTGIATSLEVFVGAGQSQPGVTLSVR